MVTINNLDIEISGFRILPIENYFDLTTANNIYEISPNDGGIKVIPGGLSITNIESGLFYITQVCKYHKLEIKANDKVCSFEIPDVVFKDTTSPKNCHFKLFSIKDNIITSIGTDNSEDLIFFDAPFLQVFSYFNSVFFSAAFETWFQYKDTINADELIKPILKFDWLIQASATNTNDIWVCNEKHSSVDDIKTSIKFFGREQRCLSPCDLPHLGTEVNQFKLINRLFKPGKEI